ALSWSLDHLGPMTRTVRDAAVMLGIIAGHDPRDGTTSRRAVPDYTVGIDNGIAGLRVGLPDNYYLDGVTADVEAAVREAARAIEALGAPLRPITLPDPAILHGIGNVIARAESSVIH